MLRLKKQREQYQNKILENIRRNRNPDKQHHHELSPQPSPKKVSAREIYVLNRSRILMQKAHARKAVNEILKGIMNTVVQKSIKLTQIKKRRDEKMHLPPLKQNDQILKAGEHKQQQILRIALKDSQLKPVSSSLVTEENEGSQIQSHRSSEPDQGSTERQQQHSSSSLSSDH